MSKKNKKKNVILINIEYFFALISIHLIRLLPLSVAYRINSVLTWIAFTVDFHHRNRAVQHILHSGLKTNQTDARKLAYQSFNSMGKIWVETIKFDQFITPENIADHITWAGDQEGIETIMSDNAVIFVGAHFGNWEISGLGCSILVKPIVSVFRMFDNPKIGEFILNKRKMFKQEICSKKNAMKPLLKAVRAKKALGILADQHASTSEGVVTDFFGHPARTHTSPAFLHLKTKTPIVVGVSRRIDDKMNFEYIIKGPFTTDNSLPEEEQVKDITQQFTSALEEIIREYPEQWLWCHRRWLDINRNKKKK